jgi:ankyrin repeat protein
MVVSELVAAGANPNLRRRDGAAPLHIAAATGQLRVVEYLCSLPFVDVDARDNAGATVADVAVAAEHVLCAQLLAKVLADTSRPKVPPSVSAMSVGPCCLCSRGVD